MFISRNQKGITLIIAIATIMALSILATSVISVTGSQAYLGQAQIDKIKAEQLAKGAFWVYYMTRMTTGTGQTVAATTLDGKTFTPTIIIGSGQGPEGTDRIRARVSSW